MSLYNGQIALFEEKATEAEFLKIFHLAGHHYWLMFVANDFVLPENITGCQALMGRISEYMNQDSKTSVG